MILQRVEPVDVLARPEGTLLLYERELVRLSPLGGEIFAGAARPVPLEDLADRLAAAFGAPEGDLLDATRVAVQQLVTMGVLREVA